MKYLSTIQELEEAVGSRPIGVMMKSLDALDAHCIRLLALSPLAVLGFADAEGIAHATTVGGEPGFAEVLDQHQLRFTLPESIELHARIGCGMLFFIPALGETLRVNGRAAIEGEQLIVKVEEAFIHCAKALIRSAFWSEKRPAAPSASLGPVASGPLAQAEVLELLAATPFVALMTWDARGDADVSPKGDPAGFLRLAGERRVAVPDRPGNRRTDTYHNLVEQPRMALLAFLPGDNRLLEVTGRARVTRDADLLAGMAVDGKTPKAALVLDVSAARVFRSQALESAGIWDPSRQVPRSQLPDMGEIFTDHVRQSKQRGLAATAVRALANKHLLSKALEHDYKQNLY